MSGSRLSMISNGSGGNPGGHRTTDADTVNTHPEMIAGKQRSQIKSMKRTNSYKKALNRQSANDGLDVAITEVASELQTSEVRSSDRFEKKDGRLRRAEDKTRYHTLPTHISDIESVHHADDEKRRRDSDIQRNSSQRSGHYPSPDTDEDQNSSQLERKKKSRFKRVKERLFQTFRKDRPEKADKYKKQKNKLKAHAPKHRAHVRSHNSHLEPKPAFTTPQDDASGNKIEVRTSRDELNNNSESKRAQEGASDNKGAASTENPKKKRLGIFESFRKSFRRKDPPTKYRTSSEIHTPSSDSLHHISGISSASSNGPRNEAAVSRPNVSHGQTSGAHANTPKSTEADNDDEVAEEGGAEDNVTKFFAELINPSPRRRPDTSKLRLEGLQKHRPLSFQSRSSQRRPLRRGRVTRSTFHGTEHHIEILEIDGDPSDRNYDEADCASGDEALSQERSDVEMRDVVEAEQQHQIDEVAERLAAIGDRIAKEREAESETSEVEGLYPGGPRRLSAMEEDIVKALRKYADTRENEMRGKGVNLFIVPILKDILAAQTYKCFKQVVRRELANTHGWDQVAWYTYLMRTAVCIAGTGRQLGAVVSTRARRFFSSDLRPFVETRPDGWESVHEETDIDTELD